MIYNPSVQYEVDCDVVGIATSQQVSCLGRMRSGVLDQFLRKQSMVAFAFFQTAKRIGLHFEQPLSLALSYIVCWLTCLFRFVCSVFLLQGTVFLFFVRLSQILYFYTLGSFSVCKFCIVSKDHLAYLGFGKTQSKAWFVDNDYKFSFASPRLMRDGV